MNDDIPFDLPDRAAFERRERAFTHYVTVSCVVVLLGVSVAIGMIAKFGM